MISSYVYLDCSIYSLIFNRKRSLDCAVESTQEAARKKCREKHSTTSRECFSRFLSALQQNRAQSRLPYLFCNKEFVTLPTHYIQFSKANNIAARTLHNIARYNKPIRILARMVQII